MAKKFLYQPDYAVPPGATLKETIDIKGLSQSDLALRMGMADKTISQIINGIAPITYETAEKLELVLGISAQFWNTAEARYRESLLRKEETIRLENDAKWLQDIPLADLIERNYIQQNDDKRSLVRQALRFFGVSSVEAWRNTWLIPAAQYRGKAVQEKRPGYVATWLRMGEIQAEGIETKPFNASKFKRLLVEARKLTLIPAKEWQNKLSTICATAGVAVVFTKEIQNASVSGATRWPTKEKALIQLSLKYKSDDQLWFTFFHEAGHILLHSKKQVFIDYGMNNTTDEEREANEFAKNILIPVEYQSRLPYLKTRAQIREYANMLGIAPGIVVGRLQHDDFILPSAFNDLKQKLTWI